VKVLIAPDSFGGTLRASEVAAAFVDGWRRARPGDQVAALPLSDGGEGLIDVLAAVTPEARLEHVEVAGADTRPRDAGVLWLDATTVVIETAEICGFGGVPLSERRPLDATSYGVGQALRAVLNRGATHVIVGLGGTATVDGGSGALNGFGFRLSTADGSGLRVGAGDLATVRSITAGWSAVPEGVTFDLLADVAVPLVDAVPRFGPQKGLTPTQVPQIAAAMAAWGELLTATFPGSVDVDAPGAGAAGGLGLALALAFGGRLVSGADWVATRVGLDAAVAGADLVVTGEGRLDATSAAGKVVAHVIASARRHGRPAAAVVGSADRGAAAALGLDPSRVLTAPASGPGEGAHAAVRTAAEALARTVAAG
jgi:glycerate 2-kinase